MFQQQFIKFFSIIAVLFSFLLSISPAYSLEANGWEKIYKREGTVTITSADYQKTLDGFPYGYVKSVKLLGAKCISDAETEDDTTPRCSSRVRVTVDGKKFSTFVLKQEAASKGKTIYVRKFVKGDLTIRNEGDYRIEFSTIQLTYDYSIPYVLKYSSALTSSDDSFGVTLPQGNLGLIHLQFARNLTTTERNSLQILVGGAAPEKFMFWRNHLFIQAGSQNQANIEGSRLRINNFGSRKFPLKLVEAFYSPMQGAFE